MNYYHYHLSMVKNGLTLCQTMEILKYNWHRLVILKRVLSLIHQHRMRLNMGKVTSICTCFNRKGIDSAKVFLLPPNCIEYHLVSYNLFLATFHEYESTQCSGLGCEQENTR